jgi:hypothetical protein
MAAVFLAIGAQAADAAYAPKLEITIDPATSNTPIAITSKVIQASGETANRTVKVTFPAGFTPRLSDKVQLCTADQESSDTCPPASQVGTAHAETGLASLNGNVYLERVGSAGLRLAVHLSGLGGLITQNVYGDVVLTGGRITTVFDNLPNTATTLFELDLQGGDKALSVTPDTCGPAVFDAQFTSQNDEQATAQAQVVISDCPTTPLVTAVSITPTAFRAVRKFSDTERPGFSTTIRYTLSEATHGTRVNIQKRIHRRWRTLGSFVSSGDKGANAVRFDGRVRNKPLRPGNYRFLIQTTGNSGLKSKPVVRKFTIKAS